MSQELIGLEYLKKEEIENKRCNTDKPFVFISYSHDSIDTSIVNTVFNKLYDKGLNIWIDTANMPVNEEEWQESAIKALMNHNCKFAFFFRSESSLIKETIKEELTAIKRLNHISSIKTIDIWQDSKYNTSEYMTELLNKGTDYYHSFSVCKQICDVVKPECNALRLAADFKNDINKLVEKMISEAAKAGVYLNSIDEKEYQVVIVNNEKKSSFQIIDGDRVPVQDAGTRDGFEFEGWFVSNTDEEWNFSNPVHNDMEIYAKWKAVLPIVTINENTTLKEFEKICEEAEFCILLGEARNKIRHGGKGLFDYLMAALLRGCDADIFDKKNNRIIKLSGYNYNKYAVAENPDDPKTSDIQYPWTWTTACRKSMKKEDIPERFINEKGKIKSGKLEDYNAIFEELRADMTIKDVLDKFKMKERGFDTKNNELIFEAWDLIKKINLVDVKKDLGELL